MKEASFLKLDVIIQKIIGGLFLLFIPIFYGLIFLFPFGVWQVISSLTMVFIYGDRKRVPHLIFTAVWFILLLIFKDSSWVSDVFGFAYLILLPICIGFWYFNLTLKDYQLKNGKTESEYV